MRAGIPFNFLHMMKIMLLLFIIFAPSFPSYGHLYGLNYQDWKNQGDNIHIQFESVPPTPTVGNSTTMLFSVQDLRTGEHLKNFNVTITIVNAEAVPISSGVVHKFETKTIHGADFSENFTFPSGGTYYILLRVDMPTLINVAKFTVFVSSPQFQFLNMSLILLPVIIVIIIFASVLLVVVHYVYKKK